MDFIINKEETDKRKEKIVLGEIYLQEGSIGLKLTPDANISEVNYFLESYVKLEREDFENFFRKLGDED